jgi:hypothetical protein
MAFGGTETVDNIAKNQLTRSGLSDLGLPGIYHHGRRIGYRLVYEPNGSPVSHGYGKKPCGVSDR